MKVLSERFGAEDARCSAWISPGESGSSLQPRALHGLAATAAGKAEPPASPPLKQLLSPL